MYEFITMTTLSSKPPYNLLTLRIRNDNYVEILFDGMPTLPAIQQ